MNIAEFLGLPAEHSEDIIANAAAHIEQQTRAILKDRGLKDQKLQLSGEELINEFFRKQLIDAHKKTLKVKARKEAEKAVDEQENAKLGIK